MQFVIVTGMSGAGKSTALKRLEDMDFFCVDNLPIQLIKKFTEIASVNEAGINKVAIGVDIRSGMMLNRLEQLLEELDDANYPYHILFLDASNEVLLKRFKETRRTHPLVRGGRVQYGITQERNRIQFLKDKASYIIDTSNLLTRELHLEIEKIFLGKDTYSNFIINILSFGFKYGIPLESDLVFDVRFLPNPYYDLKLRDLTGNDQRIQDYVMDAKEAKDFLVQLSNMLDFLIPNYIKEGRNQLVVSIGCTGGKHRSVTLANELAELLQAVPYTVIKEHRDIDKGAIK